MSDLKELVQGKIYYFKWNSETWEILFRLDSPSFSLLEYSNKKAHFSVLTGFPHGIAVPTFKSSRKNLMENILNKDTLAYEVPLQDLPLYIYMPYKSPEFIRLIKRGPQ